MSISKTSSEEFRNGESTFIHNMSLPVHSWYRFPAGFSAEWAQRVIENHRETIGELALLDPFAGVGTTVLAGETTGVRAREWKHSRSFNESPRPNFFGAPIRASFMILREPLLNKQAVVGQCPTYTPG